MADKTVLFEAGQAGPPFLEQAGMSCEFKVFILVIWTMLELTGSAFHNIGYLDILA